METTHTPRRAMLWPVIIMSAFLMQPLEIRAQDPTVAIRLANPFYSCLIDRYCLDVQFSSTTPGNVVYGVNVRFFYDAEVLAFDTFQNFKGGYGPVNPDPPEVVMGLPGIGYSWFGLGEPGTGTANYVNGSIQLLDDSKPYIYLPVSDWVDIFQICFDVLEPPAPGSNSFCPPVIWDLRQDPSEGGYLVGDDGVIITVVNSDPNLDSAPAQEEVYHYNWTYTGSGDAPYGEPIPMVCDLGADVMFCHNHINVSIGNICGTQIYSGTILKGQHSGNNDFKVVLIDENGDTIPNAILTWEHLGQTVTAKVIDPCSGQSCWGTLFVEDKMPPNIQCVCPEEGGGENCTITCLQVQGFLDGNIPMDYYPVVIDSCDGTTVEIVNIDLNHEICENGYIRVTWLATDNSGNTATCVQQFDIVPLTMDMITVPAEFFGDCTTSTDPSVTGWPTIDGIPYTEPYAGCNLGIIYSDQVIPLCGSGRKIIRMWRFIDWCTSTMSDMFQVINLMDMEGPVLTCNPDITVSTSIWACHADVVLQVPGATDLCSGVASYQVVTPSGLMNVTGPTVLIPNLGIGDHLITWRVRDICQNTSTCSFTITVQDLVPPTVVCDLHTTVSLVGDRPDGITLVDAHSFSDGSFDNCGPVTFRARRMTGCIDFDWTTEGACIDDLPGGTPPVSDYDLGTAFSACVPFSCCDLGGEPVMVMLEATDAAGNVNYCMVEVEVQDKLPPALECPPTIYLSCLYPLNLQPGVYTDVDGDGSLNEDPLSSLFGNMLDASRFDVNDRQPIIINDPGSTEHNGPYQWGFDGWASDNCPIELSVEVVVYDDCKGNLPGNPPYGAIKLIERRFTGNDGSRTGSCLQRIWVIDYNPFYISDTNCQNEDPLDGIIWPCDITVSSCPRDLSDTGEPQITNIGCSFIGITYEDSEFLFANDACYLLLRTWKVIDWCRVKMPGQEEGYWEYTQVIKVLDDEGVDFINLPTEPVSYCLDDPGITLPASNQNNYGGSHPDASSCSVHVSLGLGVRDLCSEKITYEVRLYPFNGDEFIVLRPTTQLVLNENHEGTMTFSTVNNADPVIAANGLPYNNSACGDYHRLRWAVTDGCGNYDEADYLIRLYDCKAPVPICYNGLSTVVMPSNGEVTIWATDFNAASYDDCTPGESLVFSFSGTSYQPSFTFTCNNVPAFGEPIPVQIWVGDGGSDQNCNGIIEWNERNSDYCETYIVIDDNTGVCAEGLGGITGEIRTEMSEAVSEVSVFLTGPEMPGAVKVTSHDGIFRFTHLQLGEAYTITPVRDDNPRNGVNTLDLVRIQRHLLGMEPFTSAYQYIAADANNSRTVSAIDLIEIRRLVLGLQHQFSSNTSWRFVTSGVELIPGNPWPFDEEIEIASLEDNNGVHRDFVGIKVGDVNHSAAANAQKLKPRQALRPTHVKIATKGKVMPGEEISVDFTFNEPITGFQWTMELSGLEYLGVSSDVIAIDEQHVGLPEVGMLTMSWHHTNMEPANLERPVSFSLRFRVTAQGALINMLRLTDRVAAPEAYTPADEVMETRLVYQSTDALTDFELYQNKPNPWNHQTVIGFHLPEGGPVLLTVYDGNGSIVKTLTGEYKAGYHTITLSDHDIEGEGMMYYRLESGSYSASRKMVRIR